MKNDSRKYRMAAVFVVLLMVFSSFGFVQGTSDDSDASSDSWTCTITVSGTTIMTKYAKNGATLSDTTPVNGNNGNATVGSWGFDDTTGYGPFGSYYAAVDISTGIIYKHLKPSDLSKAIDDTSIDATKYNIMWVLPTVWMSASGSTLTLSSTQTTGATAPAHTIDGKVYNYLAIGVYEAYVQDSKVYSFSGQTPTVSISIANFQTYAKSTGAGDGKSMIWNFYQWQLYRFCSLAVMENFDSQAQIGYGNASGSKTNTGTTIAKGPYYGTTSADTTGERLFIENAWGNVFDYIGDAYWSSGLWAGQNSTQVSGTTSGLTKTTVTTGLSGYGTSPYSTNLDSWGLPTSANSSWSTSAPDYIYSSASGYAVLVGGAWSSGDIAGLSYLSSGNLDGNSYSGSRLAMVFDADPAAITVNKVTYDHSALANLGASASAISKLVKEIEIEDETTTYTDLGTVEGYTHIGWYVDGTFYSVNHTVVSTDSHKAYSAWRAPSVTITFMVEGEEHSTLEVPKGSVGIVYTPVQVEGVFMGWYYDASYSEKYDATKPFNDDDILYAKGVKPLTFTSVPTANATITNIDANGLVYFDATDNAGRLSVLWDFGDGNTSTDPIAYNSYAQPGTYDVTLTVTNALGETAQKTYQVVYAGPDDGADDGKDPTLLYAIIGLIVLVALISIARRFI